MRRFVVCGISGCMLILSQGCGSPGEDSPESSAASPPPVAATQDAALVTDPVEPLNSTPIADAPQLSLPDAARQGNIGALRDAIARGEPVNQGDDKFNNTPVMFAVMSDCTPCLQLLLEAGADLEIRNTSQATALMWAAMQASSATVKFLIDNGADVYAQTPSGKNPLALANARKEDPQKAMIIVLLEQAQRQQ